MKALQKLTLPLLIVIAIALIYTFYFAPTGELGQFSDFDPNNTASKQIKVGVVHSRAVDINMEGGTATFYAVDKDGVEVLIQAPAPLPNGFDQAEAVTLTGHLHKEYFHAHAVELE